MNSMNNVFITNQHQHNNNKKKILVRYYQELQLNLLNNLMNQLEYQ